jgi:nucleotide-binding universal stress UspA family protein
LRTIVVPTDFSKSAERALGLARDLAQDAGPAHLILTHAVFVPIEIEALGVDLQAGLSGIEERVVEDLERILVELQDAGISAEYLSVRGSPERIILEVASSKNADLIVMGTHGRTGLAHVVLGSVAERVVREAPCPVLTVKA